jgi:glycosyltransferase involved in cell wall biosynthesis
MRILVVSQYFWPENFRINDLVSELAERGHEVSVLTGCPNYPAGVVFEDFKKDRAAYSQYGSAEVIRVPLVTRGRGGMRLIFNYLSFAISASLLGAWRLRKRQFDAIFTFEPSPVTVGLPAVFLRWMKQAPLVFWVLDLWPETLQAIGVVRSKWLLGAVGALVRFIYDRCDLLLAQSKSFIPQIRRLCSETIKIEYFPNWSDVVFDYSRVEAAPDFPVAAGAFNILFAGNIGDAQDFPAILQAADSTRDEKKIRWIILGEGRAAIWVRQEIERRGLQDTVLMLGQYPLARMPSFFKHADALLVSLKDAPIFAMTIPGKLQSYLAAGIPILAMLNGEGAEIVQSTGAGIVCPAGDATALARAARELFQMSIDERREMGEKGLAVNRNEFDRATLISRLEACLASLTAASPTTSRHRIPA